jgi:hypothetical protein
VTLTCAGAVLTAEGARRSLALQPVGLLIDVAASLDGRLSGGLSTRATFWLPLKGEGRGENMVTESRTKEPSVTRRNLLKKGAAGALGAAAATAITATPASAADGDPIILGQENAASSPTRITLLDGGGHVLDIFPGGGGSPLGARVLSAAAGFGSEPAISAFANSGTAFRAIGKTEGVVGIGVLGAGVLGDNATGIGVQGRTQVGTGIKAEAAHFQSEGTAFEAVGPVKFSTSGLADVAASTDRVTVNPGVPISAQSKILATLQGNSGNKAMVEHVEVNPTDGTFQIVLTRSSLRPVEVAWFLIS